MKAEPTSHTQEDTMTTLGQLAVADERDPVLLAQLDDRLALYEAAQTVAAARTLYQIRACHRAFGIRSALWSSTSCCAECGALPGFTHPATCVTNAPRAHLGVESAATTAAIEALAR